jgi:hypothetical protein
MIVMEHRGQERFRTVSDDPFPAPSRAGCYLDHQPVTIPFSYNASAYRFDVHKGFASAAWQEGEDIQDGNLVFNNEAAEAGAALMSVPRSEHRPKRVRLGAGSEWAADNVRQVAGRGAAPMEARGSAASNANVEQMSPQRPSFVTFVNRRERRGGLRPRDAAYLVVAVWLIAVVAWGILEHFIDRDNFPTIWLGMWWALETVTTVGYGDVVPTTTAGRGVASVLLLGGLAFISVVTATITYTTSTDSTAVGRAGVAGSGWCARSEARRAE